MPVIAAITDTSYKIVLVLHIVAVVVGFAPAVATVVAPRAAASDRGTLRIGRIVHAPALILVGLLGLALVGMSDKAWSFSDGWVSAALLLWIAVVGVYQAMVIRGGRAGGASGRRQVVLGSQIIAVLLVVLVYLMVFKPGS